MANWQNEIDGCSKWMKEYCKNAKKDGIVVGLSGGIDSSVIACLSVKAVGKENVTGVMMPCESTPDTISDAKILAKNLGIKNVMMGLWPTFKMLTSDLAEPDVGESYPNINLSARAKGNIKARLRMTILYALAEANNYLVCGTGNLSELQIGFATKFGDLACDIEPIGNFYKTQVYKMAELMPEIPKNIKTKAPSADLEPCRFQTDEEDIGMSYKKLDEILVASRLYWTYSNVYKDQGISEEDWDKVISMRIAAIHKNELPPRYEKNKITR